MNLRLSWALSVCGLAAVISGCTTPSAISRAQSPETAAPVYNTGETVVYYGDSYGFPSAGDVRAQRQDARFVSQGILAPMGSPYRDMSTRYRTLPNQPGCPTGQCPTGQCPTGQCPSGQCGHRSCPHGYQVNGTDFWPGGCPLCQADYIAWQPHHRHSFSYHVPRNMTWPQQNAVGGAVVYPYYTHKGPSDFFRDDPRNER